VIPMNLVEFISEHNIKSVEGEEFDHSPEFARMRAFEQTCHVVRGVPFLEPETYEVREFNIVLKGAVQEKWDRKEKKTKRQFFIDRTFSYPGEPEDVESIDDVVSVGSSIDEAIATFEAEREHFEFFKRYDLIDAGRYWLNRELQRCFIEDGRVIVMDTRGGDGNGR
jgi:hypothetical protein